MDRKIIIGLIIVLCIAAIVFGVLEVVISKKKTSQNLIGTVTEDEVSQEKTLNDMSYEEIINKFNGLFDNTIDVQGTNIIGLSKIDSSKDNIVYTVNHYKGESENKYKLEARVPNININNDEVKKINKEINEFYSNRVNTIIKNSNSYMVYNVTYKAYINYNIVSLVIKETLQVNNSSQQTAVKTYNYDIKEQKRLLLANLMNEKELSADDVTDKINYTLNLGNEQAKNEEALGAKVYYRDANNEIYDLENCNTYFLGANKELYLIYTYNQKDVSDYDVVIVK